MSIGLSVDYTAHTTSHFQRHRQVSANTLDCITRSLDAIAWPMLQSAISTVLCVVPLFFSFAYTTRVFFSTICLVTALGLAHGVIVVPCVFLCLAYARGERIDSAAATAAAATAAAAAGEKRALRTHDAQTADATGGDGGGTRKKSAPHESVDLEPSERQPIDVDARL